jgi:hypothetical protein
MPVANTPAYRGCGCAGLAPERCHDRGNLGRKLAREIAQGTEAAGKAVACTRMEPDAPCRGGPW